MPPRELIAIHCCCGFQFSSSGYIWPKREGLCCYGLLRWDLQWHLAARGACRTRWEGDVPHPSQKPQVVFLCLTANTSHAACKARWLRSERGKARKAVSGSWPGSLARHSPSSCAWKAGPGTGHGAQGPACVTPADTAQGQRQTHEGFMGINIHRISSCFGPAWKRRPQTLVEPRLQCTENVYLQGKAQPKDQQQVLEEGPGLLLTCVCLTAKQQQPGIPRWFPPKQPHLSAVSPGAWEAGGETEDRQRPQRSAAALPSLVIGVTEQKAVGRMRVHKISQGITQSPAHL